ncbi:MAG: ATP-binding cassette domain-containing protein [Acidimicrobiia bacterium]|nr:ATP-binding cassette domain-containing protein [Acidimicrobiia bacterium]
MERSPVVVEDLTKIFKVPVREGGLRESVKSLFKREHKMVHAVDGISFEVGEGEIVGFLGPNGAGKTTTLKMLSGLLHAESGKADVLGHTPWQRSKELLSQITLVLGQRQNLAWDLPALDSFDLNKAIYQIPTADFERRRERFIEILDIGEIVTKPVRNLSLGERMKVEICAALLHGPKVLFLDEPTIGLDVTMQRRLREFVLDYNASENAAVLLTSHYMADITALAQRVIVIHHGKILYDGGLQVLAEQFGGEKTITVHAQGVPGNHGYGGVIEQTSDKLSIRVPRSEVAATTSQLLNELNVLDLSIEDPPIEEVIERVFATPKDQG